MRYQVQNAKTINRIPLGDEYVLEPKYDGARIVAEIWEKDGESGVTFWTRTGKAHPGDHVPLVAESLIKLFPADTWIDGELVKFTDNASEYRNDWGAVQSVLGSTSPSFMGKLLDYVVFDLLAMSDHDARSLPLRDRRELLKKAIIGKDSDPVALSVQVGPAFETVQLQGYHDILVEKGWEGSMIKDLTQPYHSGKRGYGWYKFKATSDIDAVIMGFEDGKNDFEGLVGAIIFGQYDDQGTLIERGKCSGFDMALRKDMTEHPEKYLKSVITVKHMGITKHGNFRHPQFDRLRPDKPRKDVTIHND
jgi:ATP-dependent DNA ligase